MADRPTSEQRGRLPRGLSKVASLGRQAGHLGALGSARYAWHKLRKNRTASSEPFRLRAKHAATPVWARPGTSDIHVFKQIFADREYRCLDHLADAGLVIDCGANVGYSCVYFLSRFPNVAVVAIEPESGNFEMLRRNTAPFASRVRLVKSGVWPRSAPLVVDRGGPGTEWAVTVREARGDEAPDLMGTDLTTVWRDAGGGRISVLKVDIEGSEAEVFAAADKPWLDAVDNLVVELHGDECRRVFFDAIAGRAFDVSTCDELTVCKRRD